MNQTKVQHSESKSLIADAQACTQCTRMLGSRRVLSDRNGNWTSEVMFVAEAPGRLGAQLTGVPLFGDRTGDRFESLLVNMGWNRSEIFITNAVLCNPKDERGNNDLPTAREIKQCSCFLRRTLLTVNPKLVVALGRVALTALSLIESHQLELRNSAGRVVKWNGRHLGILYHPGPRTQVHRKWAEQIQDAKEVAKFASDVLGITLEQSPHQSLFRDRENGMKLAGD